MRLLLAARLSQLADRQTGLDTQDEDARIWATTKGHTIVGVAADHISGRVSPFERRHLGPWLTDPNRMAMYDGILITKLDRLTRGRDWNIRQWAEENDKKILVVSPELVWPPLPGDAATPIIWDNLVNLASGEWENISIRYRRMQKALREQGYFVGKKPYGLRIVELDNHKTLEPDPVNAAIVRGMAKRYLDGQSLRQIAGWLVASAIPPPQPPKNRKGKGWTAEAVNRILRNPAIAGRVQTKGRTVLRVEPLISIADFNRIQEMLTSRASHGARQGSALLTGMLICNNGNAMYRIKGRGWKGEPNPQYYYCRECPKGERLMVTLAEMDLAVHDAVMQHKDEPHIITTVTPGDTYAEEINEIKKEISSLDPEDEEYDTHLASLRAEIKQLRNLPRKAATITNELDGKTVGEVWESLDPAGKRRWLLARRGSNWLPGQEAASVQVFGRDPDTGTLITDIDIGEVTESIESLRRL